MRVLLVGNKAHREKRSKLLRDSGYDARGVEPIDAGAEIGKPETRCLVLGATVPEETAARLATEFHASGPNRFIVRLVESATGTTYPYASVVVNPNNSQAFLAAVGAIEETERFRTDWEIRLSEIGVALNDPRLDPELRRLLEIAGFEIKELLRHRTSSDLRAS
jgi:hypothetical protein